jgi:hypothetical protein
MLSTPHSPLPTPYTPLPNALCPKTLFITQGRLKGASAAQGIGVARSVPAGDVAIAEPRKARPRCRRGCALDIVRSEQWVVDSKAGQILSRSKTLVSYQGRGGKARVGALVFFLGCDRMVLL